MKRLSKIFLVAGLILFGLSGFTGCAGEVSGSSDTPSEQGGGAGDGGGAASGHVDEIAVDFSQSTIPASTYTYPATVDHVVHPKEPDLPAVFTNPTYHLSEATGSSSDAPGASVKSKDNIITVTPYYDGLHIVVDYNTTEESKTWKHNSLQIKNVTDNQAPIEVGVDVDETELKSEFTFTFTEKNKTYKVWLTHMDIDWHDWGTTEANAAEVTAIGGSGTVNAVASDIRIEKDSNDKRIIRMNNLTITGPMIPDSLDVYVRAENGSQWGNGAVCEPSVSFELANNKNYIKTYTDSNDDLNTFLAGKQYLFIILSYKFNDANGKGYKQDIYSNYDKWISDYWEPLPVSAHKFPLIKITSTENGGTNFFVTEPIAHHVKDSAQAWEDPDYLNVIPDPWYEVCDISVDNGAVMKGQVKVRGNWTTSYDKKSLRIKFDKKQNLCDLHAGEKFKNWVLLAVWKDASFLRDAAGFYLYKEMFSDYYASDCKLVEVEVNGEYMGVYLLAEQQEVKPGRIDITETDKATGTDIGYFIEYDSYYTSEKENERFEINYGGEIKDYNGKVLKELQKGYTIKSDINNAAQKEFIMKYMNRLWRICYEAVYNKKYYKFTDNLTLAAYTPEGDTDDKKCENCISEIIDVKSLADMYIFNELVCDPDIYLTSFLMDVDFGEGADRKLRFEAPWDFDSTMGNKRFCTDAASSGVYVGKNDMFAGACQTDVNCEHERIHANPWMVIFIRQGWFQKLVKEEWEAVKSLPVLSGVTSYIGTLSDTEYEEVFNYTRNKWGTAVDNSELCPESKTATATSQKASADYLKTWLTNRFTAVGTIIEGLTTN